MFQTLEKREEKLKQQFFFEKKEVKEGPLKLSNMNPSPNQEKIKFKSTFSVLPCFQKRVLETYCGRRRVICL